MRISSIILFHCVRNVKPLHSNNWSEKPNTCSNTCAIVSWVYENIIDSVPIEFEIFLNTDVDIKSAEHVRHAESSDLCWLVVSCGRFQREFSAIMCSERIFFISIDFSTHFHVLNENLFCVEWKSILKIFVQNTGRFVNSETCLIILIIKENSNINFWIVNAILRTSVWSIKIHQTMRALNQLSVQHNRRNKRSRPSV